MNQVEEASKRLEDDIAELRRELPDWDRQAVNSDGSKKLRGIAERVGLSAKRLESIVRSNTFSR